MVQEITDQNFKEVIESSDKIVMIDFWAEWCGPCKTMLPVINSIEQEHSDHVMVGKVNVDTSPDVSSSFGIRNIPTIIFMKNGQVVDKSIGVVPKSVLEEKILSLKQN